MFNPMMNMALFFLLMSTIMVVLSSSWPMIWLMMEMNMLMFIPWLNFKTLNKESEASVKYFLCQTLGSAILIFSSISLMKYSYVNILLLVALCLKVGSFPCYVWFISVMKASNWVSCSMLMTWQKIAPVFIITKFVPLYNNVFFFIAMTNIAIGGLFGLNQADLRSMMAYSSVAHLGWMFSLTYYSAYICVWEYFLLYLLILTPTCVIFTSMSTTTGNELFNMNLMNPSIKIKVMVMIMSLAGLPPLSGFMLKVIALNQISMLSMNTAVTMVLLSTLSLYMYLMMILPNSLMTKPSMKQKSKKMLMKTLLLNSIMLPLIMIMYALTLLNKS